MNEKRKLQAGDRVLWKHESGELFPATLTDSPPGAAFKAAIELDEYLKTLLHGRVGRTQYVPQEQLLLKENLQPISEKASRDRIYAYHILEEALAEQGVPLSDEQMVIVWAALEHILLKERLGLGWR